MALFWLNLFSFMHNCDSQNIDLFILPWYDYILSDSIGFYMSCIWSQSVLVKEQKERSEAKRYKLVKVNWKKKPCCMPRFNSHICQRRLIYLNKLMQCGELYQLCSISASQNASCYNAASTDIQLFLDISIQLTHTHTFMFYVSTLNYLLCK